MATKHYYKYIICLCNVFFWHVDSIYRQVAIPVPGSWSVGAPTTSYVHELSVVDFGFRPLRIWCSNLWDELLRQPFFLKKYHSWAVTVAFFLQPDEDSEDSDAPKAASRAGYGGPSSQALS